MDTASGNSCGAPHDGIHAQRYLRASAGLQADLAAAGIDVCVIEDLRGSLPQVRQALPILAAWLPRIGYGPLKETVVRLMAGKWAREYASLLISEFSRETYDLEPASDSGSREASVKDIDDDFRAVVGLAIHNMADDDLFDELAAIAENHNWGEARSMPVLALGRMRTHRAAAIPLLESILSDGDSPNTVSCAIQALRRLESWESRHLVEPLASSAEWVVRSEAKKLLRAAG